MLLLSYLKWLRYAAASTNSPPQVLQLFAPVTASREVLTDDDDDDDAAVGAGWINSEEGPFSESSPLSRWRDFCFYNKHTYNSYTGQ